MNLEQHLDQERWAEQAIARLEDRCKWKGDNGKLGVAYQAHDHYDTKDKPGFYSHNTSCALCSDISTIRNALDCYRKLLLGTLIKVAGEIDDDEDVENFKKMLKGESLD